ncbi:TMEM175 family protein [Algoriphagus mannitolivorans]|uniref:TMEM175 family protein n=1 Tax=Algoriphagus mannitolivorans TaxID=226504 RepID=UPI000429250C|nr:TMEM175 family protein [Algoriphagus mannitolivorans]
MKSKISNTQSNLGFSLRGLENTRIESLSDGVFAIAIGLLLLSSSPPETFAELKIFIQDFIPFAGTISILMTIWYQHYLFFIRFGLRDASTTAINTILLFLVLFYTYPLKFLFQVLIQIYRSLIMNDRELMSQLFQEKLPLQDAPELMVIYGLGASAIFFVFVWLNYRALKKSQDLSLSPLEVALTKNSILMNSIAGGIPMLSGLFAYFELAGSYTFMYSGFIYLLYPLLMPLAGYLGGKKLQDFQKNNH